jgi:hypothetical protein
MFCAAKYLAKMASDTGLFFYIDFSHAIPLFSNGYAETGFRIPHTNNITRLFHLVKGPFPGEDSNSAASIWVSVNLPIYISTLKDYTLDIRIRHRS